MTMSSEPQQQQQQQPQLKPNTTSPTLSTILNKKSSSTLDTPMKEYLPTPVTPASDFPHQIQQQHNKKDTSSNTTTTTSSLSSSSSGVYSTFSVIKPPQPPSQSSSSSTSTSPRNNNSNTQNTSTTTTTDAKPYPCPECHQTFSRPHNLKSHLTTHSSERPFQVRKKLLLEVVIQENFIY